MPTTSPTGDPTHGDGTNEDPTEDRLLGLAYAALDHGYASIADGTGPLIPFVLSHDPAGPRTLQRVLAATLEDALAQAVDLLAGIPATHYAALAYDGYLTDPDGRHDAIIVQAHGPDQTRLRVAQRYATRRGLRTRTRKVGDPVLLPT